MSAPNPMRAVQNLSPTRRFLLLGAVAAAIVLVWWVGNWASTPTYVSLYRDLELGEAAAVADNLDKAGIAHKLSGGGTEVLVASSDLARARVTLAKDGLPARGRPGLELFDKPSWGMTDFTQRVTYQRALEGELTRTISGLQGIEQAQVHLVLPTQSPLRRLERPAGASVVVTLRPGVALTPDAVQGITYIVSNSVEQLSSDNVAVMDDAGHLLSVPASGAAGMSTRQLDIQRSVERYLAAKVEELLAPAVGLGRVRAQVSALLSFEQVDRTIESFDPDGQVLQNEQRSETEAVQSSGAQTIVNNAYQNTRRLEKIIGSAGNVTRLTVAVLVDEKAFTAGAAPGAASPRLEQIESMVWNAIGVDSTRGDRVTVMTIPFEANLVTSATSEAGAKGGGDALQWVERLTRPLVGLVAVIGLLILTLAILRGGVATAPGGGTAAAPESGGSEPRDAGGNVTPISIRGRSAPEGGEGADTTAQVLRAWLTESS